MHRLLQLFTGKEEALDKLKEIGVEPLAAMIFDVDGTLWDTTEAAAKIWSDVAAKYPEVKDTVTAEKPSQYGPRTVASTIFWRTLSVKCSLI
mgnify:CR=1 FL=1